MTNTKTTGAQDKTIAIFRAWAEAFGWTMTRVYSRMGGDGQVTFTLSRNTSAKDWRAFESVDVYLAADGWIFGGQINGAGPAMWAGAPLSERIKAKVQTHAALAAQASIEKKKIEACRFSLARWVPSAHSSLMTNTTQPRHEEARPILSREDQAKLADLKAKLAAFTDTGAEADRHRAHLNALISFRGSVSATYAEDNWFRAQRAREAKKIKPRVYREIEREYLAALAKHGVKLAGAGPVEEKRPALSFSSCAMGTQRA